MKYISKFCLFFCLSILLVACMPERTEIWINKDGSGKMITSLNMGESAGQVKSMMSAMDTTQNKTSSDSKFEEEMDSTMYLFDIMPDSVKNKLSNPDLAKNAYIRMKQGDGDFYVHMGMEYDNEEELKDLVMFFKEIGDSKRGKKSESADVTSMFSSYQSDLKNGIIRMKGMDISSYENDPEMEEVLVQFDSLLILKDKFETLSEEKQQEFKFMYAMFETMFLKETTTIIHLPGKVLFSNRPDAIVDGNVISYKTSLYQLLKGESNNSEWIIKYKP